MMPSVRSRDEIEAHLNNISFSILAPNFKYVIVFGIRIFIYSFIFGPNNVRADEYQMSTPTGLVTNEQSKADEVRAILQQADTTKHFPPISEGCKGLWSKTLSDLRTHIVAPSLEITHDQYDTPEIFSGVLGYRGTDVGGGSAYCEPEAVHDIEITNNPYLSSLGRPQITLRTGRLAIYYADDLRGLLSSREVIIRAEQICDTKAADNCIGDVFYKLDRSSCSQEIIGAAAGFQPTGPTKGSSVLLGTPDEIKIVSYSTMIDDHETIADIVPLIKSNHSEDLVCVFSINASR